MTRAERHRHQAALGRDGLPDQSLFVAPGVKPQILSKKVLRVLLSLNEEIKNVVPNVPGTQCSRSHSLGAPDRGWERQGSQLTPRRDLGCWSDVGLDLRSRNIMVGSDSAGAIVRDAPVYQNVCPLWRL